MKRAFCILVLLLLATPACARWFFGECSADERALFQEAVRDAILAEWTVPYDDSYIACTVLLTLNWRGEVLNVGIANCGDDRRVHRSVVNAGYSVSPLQMPANRSCFERNIIVQIEYRPMAFGDGEESVDPE